MTELYEMIVKLGPGWANLIFLGVTGGTLIYIIANRQYLKMVREGHAEQLKLKDQTIEMLKSGKADSELILTQAKSDAVKERDVYRDKLHEEKANHQATLLRLAEMEKKPDLSRLLELEQSFHKEKVTLFDQLFKTLAKLDEKIEKEMKHQSKICDEQSRSLQGLIRLLVKQKVLPEEYNNF